MNQKIEKALELLEELTLTLQDPAVTGAPAERAATWTPWTPETPGPGALSRIWCGPDLVGLALDPGEADCICRHHNHYMARLEAGKDS